MLEKCSHSMQHWEHMCSLTENGCAAMETLRHNMDHDCTPCEDKSHRHFAGCTSSYVAA
ncbi:hypothetical protein SAMN06269301_0364 [Geobacter sp. DSM 9736]|nr:hypothetical protein SAMN06269301_0364 [Geobacter sp. DSM 9736]